jgi:hypothetical protein
MRDRDLSAVERLLDANLKKVVEDLKVRRPVSSRRPLWFEVQVTLKMLPMELLLLALFSLCVIARQHCVRGHPPLVWAILYGGFHGEQFTLALLGMFQQRFSFRVLSESLVSHKNSVRYVSASNHDKLEALIHD